MDIAILAKEKNISEKRSVFLILGNKKGEAMKFQLTNENYGFFLIRIFFLKKK